MEPHPVLVTTKEHMPCQTSSRVTEAYLLVYKGLTEEIRPGFRVLGSSAAYRARIGVNARNSNSGLDLRPIGWELWWRCPWPDSDGR